MNIPGTKKPEAGGGSLLIWHDASPGGEGDIERWYNAEHHFERLSIPGFLEARRYQSLDAETRRFMCLYRTVDPSILTSAPYLECVNNPTPWTRTVMPLYRNFSRTICKTILVAGRTRGEWSAALAFSLEAQGIGDSSVDKAQAISKRLLCLPGILRCEWLQRAEPQAAPASSVETKLRGKKDKQIDVAILMDTDSKHQASHALVALEDALRQAAIHYEAQQRGCYQQVFFASSSDVLPATQGNKPE
ncbi:MAG: hypothetical protein WBA83_01065 [Burkholderiaceae bacterium]